MTPTLHIQPSLTELSHLLAERFIHIANECIRKQGSCHVALSGGRTPQLFYALLASDTYTKQLSWDNIHLYMSDERFVNFSHPDSNFGMIQKNLISQIPIPTSNIHPIQTETITAEVSAVEYEKTIKKHLPKDFTTHPQFDYILLGLGEDGHIASLFPHSKMLNTMETLVAAEFISVLQSWRISLTLPAINNAKYIALLVANPNKAHVLTQVLSDQTSQNPYPIEMINPKGQFEWFLDDATAEKIHF